MHTNKKDCAKHGESQMCKSDFFGISRLVTLAAALACIGLSPGRAQAAVDATDSDATCANAFSSCVDFTLSHDGNTGLWTLVTDYVSAPSGLLTATGAYYNAGKTAPAFDIADVTLINAPAGWQAGGCTDLNLNSGSTDLLSACGSTTHGINNALAPGQILELTFTADAAFMTAVSLDQIDYRGHVQDYGPTSCSIKLDTGVEGNIGSADTSCTPVHPAPEPASLGLLSLGLAGIGLLRRKRRT